MPHWLIHDFGPLIQVVLIDITLAGDNAVVVGLAVAGLPAEQRRLAIVSACPQAPWQHEPARQLPR